MTITSGVDHIPKRCVWVIGVDEAGRGPLAGPLSVGLVMVRRRLVDELIENMPLVRDSKKISAPKRDQVMAQARELEVQGKIYARTILSSAYNIDDLGTSQCIRESITEGIDELIEYVGCTHKDVFVQLDGALKAPAQYRQQTYVGGDNKYFAISLASIYAKTTRDGVMEQYDIKYPQYNFYAHKGYGTKEHLAMITKHGTCPIHKQTFLKKFYERKKKSGKK